MSKSLVDSLLIQCSIDELIENLQRKVEVCKRMNEEEGQQHNPDIYRLGKIIGMLDGFEYAIDKLKELQSDGKD